METALASATSSSLAEAARVDGVWQTDSSRHTVGQQVTGVDPQGGVLLVALGLDLLDIRKFPLLDLTWSLPLLPLILALLDALYVSL